MPPFDAHRHCHWPTQRTDFSAMTSDMKKLEGLGKLLKAAGVKPAGAEAMVRDHIDEIQADARQHHAELIASVKALKEELIELQHNHASSVSEIRMATDVMRHEIEARSVAFGRTLHIAKFVLIIVVALQVILLVSIHTTTGSNLLDLSHFIPASETSNDVQVPSPTSSPQGAATK
jgi:hypothetical protein